MLRKRMTALALGLMLTAGTANTVFAQAAPAAPAVPPSLGKLDGWTKALYDASIRAAERMDKIEARIGGLETRVGNNRSLINRGIVADMVQSRAFDTVEEATDYLDTLNDAGLDAGDVKKVVARTTVPMGGADVLISTLTTDEARARLMLALGLPTLINAAIDAKLKAAVDPINARLDAIEDLDSVEQVREALSDDALVQEIATAMVGSLSDTNRDELINQLTSEIVEIAKGQLSVHATTADLEALARHLHGSFTTAIEQVDIAYRAADQAIGSHLGSYSDPREKDDRGAASTSASNIVHQSHGSVAVETFEDLMAAFAASRTTTTP